MKRETILMKTEFKNMPPWTEGFPNFTGHVKFKQNKKKIMRRLKTGLKFYFSILIPSNAYLNGSTMATNYQCEDDFLGGCNLFGYVCNCGLEFFIIII